MSTTTTLHPILCDWCERPITRRRPGFLSAPWEDIRRRGYFVWTFHHTGCDVNPDGYWLDALAVATQEGRDWWTKHLSRKRWIDRSNWADLMARLEDHA